MTSLTVFKFGSPGDARRALDTLLSLQKQELIQVMDAATVSWPADKKKPKTEQLHSLKGAGAASGGFWGLLFGLIFLVPFLGAAIGAAMGALTGSMADFGIDDDFIADVRSQVTPGTSALFLMSAAAVVERVSEAMKDMEFELIASNLTAEQEEKLVAALADD